MPSTTMTTLQLEPEDRLSFCKTPGSPAPNRTLKLTNKHSGNVAFKVKTTAPKAYLVRPSSGTLRPKETQEVQIILQAQGAGDSSQVNNHRFLVQAVAVSSAEQVSREQWSEFDKDSIQEQRLSVVLEEREDEQSNYQASTAAGNGAASEARSKQLTSGRQGETEVELKVKYDELVQYTLMLEKQKQKLEEDMKALKDKKQGSMSMAGDKSGWSTLHIIMVAVIAFLASYVAKALG